MKEIRQAFYTQRQNLASISVDKVNESYLFLQWHDCVTVAMIISPVDVGGHVKCVQLISFT